MTPEMIAILAAATLLFVLFGAAPALVAVFRRHPEQATIVKLTPLALFSFILWVALLVWAASDKHDDAVIAKYVARLRERHLLPWIVGGLVVAGVAGGAVALGGL